MKKILVTGANGLLGQKLSDLYLSQNQINYIATGKGKNRHPRLPEQQYYDIDLLNFEALENLIVQENPDCIIHTAAMTNVDLCESEKTLCTQLNVELVKCISNISESLGIHLIALSTDFIFDGTKAMIDENETANPLSYYGESKFLGEQYIIKNHSNYAIVRTVLVYGVVNDLSRSNIVLWAKNALEKNIEISVVDDQFRTPTLAEDLAMGCYLIEQQHKKGIYNIAGADYLSIFQFVELIAKSLNIVPQNVKVAKSDKLNQAAKRPPITGLNIKKAIDELGYKPHTLLDGLKKVWLQIESLNKN